MRSASPTAIATAATLVCVVALAALVFAEYARARVPTLFPRLRTTAKIVASLAFIAVGACALASDGPRARLLFDRAILGGLVLGAAGDVCLLGKSRRAFLYGLVAFLCGHLAYLAAIAILVDPRYWLALAGVPGLAAIGVGSYAHEWLKPHLGKLKLAVGAYIIVITAMVIAAIGLARSGLLPADDSLCLGLGACLFFASDFAVARERFVARDFTNKLWGLPAYYAGQLLIAWSIV